jgi:hypothetical protein
MPKLEQFELWTVLGRANERPGLRASGCVDRYQCPAQSAQGVFVTKYAMKRGRKANSHYCYTLQPLLAAVAGNCLERSSEHLNLSREVTDDYVFTTKPMHITSPLMCKARLPSMESSGRTWQNVRAKSTEQSIVVFAHIGFRAIAWATCVGQSKTSLAAEQQTHWDRLATVLRNLTYE